MRQRIVLVATLALATVASAAGYYLPGTYPQEFFIGQQLQGEPVHVVVISISCADAKVNCWIVPTNHKLTLKQLTLRTHLVLKLRETSCSDHLCLVAADVNSLTSAETELPFDYYSLPFCKPTEGAKKSLNTINPGTILMGSRIQNSPYNFTMLVGIGTT